MHFSRVLAVIVCSSALIAPWTQSAQSASSEDFSGLISAMGEVLPVYKNELKKSELTFVPDEVIVKFKQEQKGIADESGQRSFSPLSGKRDFEIKEMIDKDLAVLRIRRGQSVEDAVSQLKTDPEVEYVEPNYILHIASLPNDPSFGKLWGLNNTGQSVNGSTGAVDSDIDAPEAWALETDDGQTAVVAVIDTGVAYNHPDLSANMWNGSAGCKDENNGAISGGCPNHGWDFFNNDNTPLDDNSHGTHLAGTIAAVSDNNIGISGLSRRNRIKIMALKAFDNQGNSAVSEVVKAISFAKNNGVKIINASFAGPDNSQALHDAITVFPGLVISAAGNEGANNDNSPSYPASYSNENIISVAATDQRDSLAGFSNYGVTSVDVGAPGVNIYSAVPTPTELLAYFEGFDGANPPNLPSGWQKTGNWGTVDTETSLGNVLFTDLTMPYTPNANSTVTSPSINLAGSSSGSLDFLAGCDTEYNLIDWTDYVAVEISGDGQSYGELFRFDEPLLDARTGDFEQDNAVAYYFRDINIPSEYLTNNFRLRFRWVTNGSDAGTAGLGCILEDISINTTSMSDGSDEAYAYNEGTSMAAPHVAGLAALLWSAMPALSGAEVKSAILATGDPVSSLAGKTVSGKRINAFNALKSVLPVTSHSISGTIKYYDGLKKVSGASVILEDSQGNQLASVASDANGNYQFNDVVGGENYIIRVDKGDNATGLTSADQIKIGRHIVQLELFDTIYKTIAGDVNNSGGLTSADQIKIGRFIVQLDASLPSGAWKFYDSDFVLSAGNYLSKGLTRKYDNLNADLENQDFIGVKMGDVNNS